MKIDKAVIIGAGVAGPATALALRKCGIESTVYEAYDGTASGIGGMLSVAPNGLATLGIIGVTLDNVGQPIRRQVIAEANGREMFGFDGLPGLPPTRVLQRDELHAALRDRAVAEGIRIVHGKRLAVVEETPREIVAHFGDGETARGDVLIGADGIRSKVRTLIDPFAPAPRYVGFLGLGGLAVGTDCDAPLDTMYFVFGKRAFMGYWRRPDGVVWFSNLPREQPLYAAEAREIPASVWLDELKHVYADDVPGRDLVAHTRAEHVFVLGAQDVLPPVPHWHRGRMVLVGDSAHAPSSSSGQGASLALESSVELARCLRDCETPSGAFAAYERLRRPRVEAIAAAAARTNNQKAAGPIAKLVMNALLPIALKTFMSPRRMFGGTHGYRIDWERRVTAA